ncbi:MAG: hypothetical protein N2645_23215 [Clostridia bacterium]|nr:hypothetical protein [Clostridia bacterium]
MSTDFDKKLSQIKDNLEKAKSLRIRAEARLEQLTKQKQDILKEIEELGVKPEDLDNEILKLRSEIEELIKKAGEMLPGDI